MVILSGKRYLIHDRDPLFTTEFLKMLADAGVKSNEAAAPLAESECPRRKVRTEYQGIVSGEHDPDR
jgi:hypothetical protein